ncbi:MAG TPA: phosphoribosylformylglycinamidine synthase subunit PurS [Gaiellales bacterium]|jgi:phosphoribosylformylglycinamidine synthase|nr:phosphoribosylformylglycinamidine synthase subunit PurS [Gaiellales bacterium]
MTRVTVTVRPKEGILDPQGEALRRSLAAGGEPVVAVRAGKVFDVEIEAASDAEALELAERIAGDVLANPLIEEHHVALAAEERVG